MLHMGTEHSKLTPTNIGLREHGMGFKLAASALSTKAYIVTQTAAAFFSEPWNATLEHVRQETCSRDTYSQKKLQHLTKEVLDRIWSENFVAPHSQQGTLIELHIRPGLLLPSDDNTDLIACLNHVKRHAYRPMCKNDESYAADFSLREYLRIAYADTQQGMAIELNNVAVQNDFAKWTAQAKQSVTFTCSIGNGIAKEVQVRITDRAKGVLMYHKKRLIETFFTHGKFLPYCGAMVEADILQVNVCKTAFEENLAWQNFVIGLDKVAENAIGSNKAKNVQCSLCHAWEKTETSTRTCQKCKGAHQIPSAMELHAPVAYKASEPKKVPTSSTEPAPLKDVTNTVAPVMPTTTTSTPSKSMFFQCNLQIIRAS